MEEEGVDYCFRCYSKFLEIEDEKFHELRMKYIASIKELEEYIDKKIDENEG